MVATLTDHTPEAMPVRHKPALILELVGPACAGKTTLVRTLTGCSTAIRVAPDISVRRPAHLAVFARNAPLLLPLLFPDRLPGRSFKWEEIKSLAYLRGWPTVLSRQAAHDSGLILLDQGPIFRLATLLAFGPYRIREPATDRWWSELFKQWASSLNLVVWLDAPNPILEERINSRDRWHLVKGKSEQEASQFLDRYRAAYQYILAKLSANGGPGIIRFDTSEASISQIATAVVAACKLEPNGG